MGSIKSFVIQYKWEKTSWYKMWSGLRVMNNYRAFTHVPITYILLSSSLMKYITLPFHSSTPIVLYRKDSVKVFETVVRQSEELVHRKKWLFCKVTTVSIQAFVEGLLTLANVLEVTNWTLTNVNNIYIFFHSVYSQRIFYYCHKVQDLCSPTLINDLSVTHLRKVNIIVIYFNASHFVTWLFSEL
jgi:hypothetical protein